MANEKYSNSIISAYRNLIDNTISDMSRTEQTIIDSPNIGTVRDGGKAIYSAELRNLLSILLTTYYSTENLDKWNELKLKLENMLKDELNYETEGKYTTEIISKNWTTNAFLKYMSYAESELTE